MKAWLKHFVWFIKTSKSFLSTSYISVILQGGLYKGIKHANYMVKYDKLTTGQKQYLYMTENRVIEL